MSKSKKTGIILVSLLIALLSFFGLIYFANSITAPDESKWEEVVCAKADITPGTYITEENVATMFGTMLVPKEVITIHTLRTTEGMAGKTVGKHIYSNELLQETDIKELNESVMAQEYTKCAQVSLSLESFSNALSGRIRAGEYIDVVVTDENKKTTKIADDLYVSNVYDSTGREIYAEDQDTVVTVVTVLIEDSDKEAFLGNVAKGSICLTKDIG